MVPFAQRPTAVFLLVLGLSFLSVAACLISPAVSANGLTASHQLTQARREFRRNATLEVNETRWDQSVRDEAGAPALADAAPIAVAALASAASVPDFAGSAPPHRLLLRPRAVVSRTSGDDVAS